MSSRMIYLAYGLRTSIASQKRFRACPRYLRQCGALTFGSQWGQASAEAKEGQADEWPSSEAPIKMAISPNPDGSDALLLFTRNKTTFSMHHCPIPCHNQAFGMHVCDNAPASQRLPSSRTLRGSVYSVANARHRGTTSSKSATLSKSIKHCVHKVPSPKGRGARDRLLLVLLGISLCAADTNADGKSLWCMPPRQHRAHSAQAQRAPNRVTPLNEGSASSGSTGQRVVTPLQEQNATPKASPAQVLHPPGLIS